ncbi:hypothetical protein EZS27_009418 [termite gut metagenome]|uniref:Uncharacterized protein n=1 Tax=termite gut metagenome TaxID=433724 RepID=A0A5J4S9Z1_9ZZZZ
MPDDGFIDHAQKKFILIAHNEAELIGYLMFRAVNRLSRLNIVHLCIKDGFRGKTLLQNYLMPLEKNTKQHLLEFLLLVELIIRMQLRFGKDMVL